MDQREHEKALKVLERDELKAQKELERQRKKDEQDAKRLESNIERARKKDEVDHQKALKELEAKAKRNSIEREEREALMNELATFMESYNKEFALASEAMRQALKTGKRC